MIGRESPDVEAMRQRFLRTGMAASGCMVFVGVVCAPLMKRGGVNWATCGALIVLAVAFALMLRTGRLWRRLDEARDAAADDPLPPPPEAP